MRAKKEEPAKKKVEQWMNSKKPYFIIRQDGGVFSRISV
jgi:hypothetical protein